VERAKQPQAAKIRLLGTVLCVKTFLGTAIDSFFAGPTKPLSSRVSRALSVEPLLSELKVTRPEQKARRNPRLGVLGIVS